MLSFRRGIIRMRAINSSRFITFRSKRLNFYDTCFLKIEYTQILMKNKDFFR